MSGGTRGGGGEGGYKEASSLYQEAEPLYVLFSFPIMQQHPPLNVRSSHK